MSKGKIGWIAALSLAVAGAGVLGGLLLKERNQTRSAYVHTVTENVIAKLAQYEAYVRQQQRDGWPNVAEPLNALEEAQGGLKQAISLGTGLRTLTDRDRLTLDNLGGIVQRYGPDAERGRAVREDPDRREELVAFADVLRDAGWNGAYSADWTDIMRRSEQAVSLYSERIGRLTGDEVKQTRQDADDFSLVLSVEKPVFTTEERMTAWAEFQYNGEQESARISHAAHYLLFTMEQVDGDLTFPGVMNQPLLHSDLKRGLTYWTDYRPVGAWEKGKPGADVYTEFAETGKLPPGKYRLHVHADFNWLGSGGSGEGKPYKFSSAIEFEVVRAGGAK